MFASFRVSRAIWTSARARASSWKVSRPPQRARQALGLVAIPPEFDALQARELQPRPARTPAARAIRSRPRRRTASGELGAPRTPPRLHAHADPSRSGSRPTAAGRGRALMRAEYPFGTRQVTRRKGCLFLGRAACALQHAPWTESVYTKGSAGWGGEVGWGGSEHWVFTPKACP